MQFATGALKLEVKVLCCCDLCVPQVIFLCRILVLRKCWEQKPGTGPCASTNFALEKWLNEKGYYKHYFCSNTYVDVSWEQLLKIMSWNDAKLMWEQNQAVCVMHFGSLSSRSLLVLSHLFQICAIPLTSLEIMRVHVRITDSAYCGLYSRSCLAYDLPRRGYTVCSSTASFHLLVCLCQRCVHTHIVLLWL